MSYEIFFQNLDNVIGKLDLIISGGVKFNISIYELLNALSDLWKKIPDRNILEFFDSMRNSSDKNEMEVLENFKTFDENKKKAVIRMMEMVVKRGRLQGDSELEKQEYWWKKLLEIQ